MPDRAQPVDGYGRSVARASVIVPARNAEVTIGRCLGALVQQDYREPYEVIVIDDGSEDRTVEVVEQSPKPLTLLRRESLGPAAARNAGVAAATGSILAFTDADCFPAQTWLSAGARALETADLVQGRVRPDPSARRHPLDRTVWVDRETGLWETANLFVKRELYDRVGGFQGWLEQRIGKQLAEDVWFGWSARRAGARTAYCPDALVDHAVFPRGVREYVGERQRLRYFVEMAEKMPELRNQFFFARWFLSKRTASFDLGLLGLASGALSRSRWPLGLTLPYILMASRRAVGWRRHAPLAIAAGVAADAVGFVGLLGTSVRRRTVVL